MLKTFSEQIVADLNAHAALIVLLDAGAVSALISEQEDGESFVNYFIKYNGFETKDGATDWQVIIESWADSYDKSIAIADEVANAIVAASNYYDYVSADSTPFFSEGKVNIVTKQIFNIKQ